MLHNQTNFQLRRRIQKTNFAVGACLVFLLFTSKLVAQPDVINVSAFEKIIVSPHIEIVFQEGEEESVHIESMTVPMEKLNVVVKNKTLHLFLDDAKITQPTKKEYINGYKRKISIYKGTVVKAIVTYKNINSIDLRGEEEFVFESSINTEKLQLKIYGEAQVFLNEVVLQDLQVALYGENYLEIKEGKIENQSFKAYGESEVNTVTIDNSETKLTSYGESEFQFGVSEKLHITSFGEASITYAGNPILNKRMIIGETEISKVNR